MKKKIWTWVLSFILTLTHVVAIWCLRPNLRFRIEPIIKKKLFANRFTFNCWLCTCNWILLVCIYMKINNLPKLKDNVYWPSFSSLCFNFHNLKTFWSHSCFENIMLLKAANMLCEYNFENLYIAITVKQNIVINIIETKS